jgi:hypothetical protein
VHSNKDLATTTPLILHHDREAAASGLELDAFDGGGPEHGESARMVSAPSADDELEELEPGPSDVNGS